MTAQLMQALREARRFAEKDPTSLAAPALISRINEVLEREEAGIMVERERTRSINEQLDLLAFDEAWRAYQKTPVDLVADSDDETCRSVHNAIVAYLAELAKFGSGADFYSRPQLDSLAQVYEIRAHANRGHKILHEEYLTIAAALRFALRGKTQASVGTEGLADWFYDNGHDFVTSDEEDVARALLDTFEMTRKSSTLSSHQGNCK